MRSTIVLLLFAATAQAEIVSLQPYVKLYGIEPWLGKLSVPRLDAAATNVYGAEDKDKSGEAFAQWVIALQQGDGQKVQVAWKRMTKDAAWRTTVTKHLVRSWPFGGLAIGDLPRARAHLDAIALFGNDDFHRTYAARRKAYLEGCTKEIPQLPDAALPRAEQVRTLIEGFRRLGPHWSCFGGPPSISGDPNTAWPLKDLGADAYPDLVIATGDLRPAGRSLSIGGEGDRVTVSYIARIVLREHIQVEESEPLLDRWIQSETWKSEKATDKWLLAHGTTPTTLIMRMVFAKQSSDRHLKNASLLVRMTASAVRADLDLLRANSPDQAPEYAFRDWFPSPANFALSSWCRAVASHGKDGRALLSETLRKTTPMNRFALIDAITYLEPKAEMEAICAPWKKK